MQKSYSSIRFKSEFPKSSTFSSTKSKKALDYKPAKSSKRFNSMALKTKTELVSTLISISNDDLLSQTKAISLVKALDICASEPGIYQEEMQKISNQLNLHLLCPKNQLETEALNLVNEELNYLSSGNSVGYFLVAKAYRELWQSALEEMDSLQELQGQAKNQLNKEILNLQNENTKLTAKLSEFEEGTISKLKNQITNLQETVSFT